MSYMQLVAENLTSSSWCWSHGTPSLSRFIVSHHNCRCFGGRSISLLH